MRSFGLKRTTKADEVALAERIARGDDAAVGELVARNVGLIHRIAMQFNAPGFTHDDFVQEGVIGALQAARKFNPGLASFGTYATPWIWRGMQRAVHMDAPMIHVPQDRRAGGEKPPPMVSLTPRTARAVVVNIEDVGAVDAVRRWEESSDLAKLLADAPLTRYQRWVLRGRFGLDGQPKILEDMAAAANLSREAIRQTEDRALAILRTFSEDPERALNLARATARDRRPVPSKPPRKKRRKR